MPKVKFSDWDELLIKSQKNILYNNKTNDLTNNNNENSFNQPNIPDISIQRGIFDLSNNNNNISTQSTSDAVRLLSSGNFDADSLTRDINTVQFKTKANTKEKLEDADIDGFITHQRDMIILSAINESRISTDYDVKSIQSKWIEDEWNQARSSFLQGLGHKTMKLEDKPPIDISIKSKDLVKPLNTSDNLSPIIKAHVDIVRNIARINHTTNNKISFRPITQLINILDKLTINNQLLDKNDYTNYKMLLDMLVSITNENSNEIIQPGSYSIININNDLINQSMISSKDNIIYSINTNVKSYYEQLSYQLYYNKILSTNLLDYCILPGETKHSKRTIVRAYVSYQTKLGVIPMTADRVIIQSDIIIPFWSLIYYHIRIGDYINAKKEIDMYLSNYSNYESIYLCGYIINYLSNYKLNSQTPDDIIVIINKLNDLLYVESTNSEVDSYKLAVYTLLTLSDPIDITSIDVYTTIEDYLWSNLYYEKYKYITNQSIINRNNYNLYSHIVQLGGPTYFNQSMYTYVYVLFACQRYGEAISYLWDIKKDFIAVHLCILCLYYGLILPHNPLISHLVISTNLTNTSNDLTPYNLLSLYLSTNYITNHIDICIDYLISLNPNYWSNQLIDKKLVDITNYQPLIMKSRNFYFQSIKQFCLLVNDVNIFNVLFNKSNGYIYNYFSFNEIKKLVHVLVNELIESTNNIELGIKLLEHIEMYIDIIKLFINQLIKIINPLDNLLDIRSHWLSLATNYYNKYIKLSNQSNNNLSTTNGFDLLLLKYLINQSRKTDVVTNVTINQREQLINQGFQSIILQYEKVLLLSNYFNILYDKKLYDDCYIILTILSIIPNSETDSIRVGQRILTSDSFVLQFIDLLVLSMIDNIYHIFILEKAKQSNSKYTGITTDHTEKLIQFINHANGIVGLGNYLKNKMLYSNTISKLYNYLQLFKLE